MRVIIAFLIVFVASAQNLANDENCGAKAKAFVIKCPNHPRNILGQADLDAAIAQNANLTAQLVMTQQTIKNHNEYMTKLRKEIKRQKCEDVERGLIYGGKCYTLHGVTGSYYMKYRQAKEECAKNGLALAEMYKRSHQFALRNYVRKIMPSKMNEIDIWIGLQYKHSTKSILLRSGEELPIKVLKWVGRNYPVRNVARGPIVFDVKRKDSVREGLWNTVANAPVAGAMCERDL